MVQGILIRNICKDDIPKIVAIQRRIYPEVANGQLNIPLFLENHISLFSKGQFCVLLLRRAGRPYDQVDQCAEEREQEDHEHPERLGEAAHVVTPEDVDERERPDHQQRQEDQEEEERLPERRGDRH